MIIYITSRIMGTLVTVKARTDTEGATESVRNNGVSLLSDLNLEKMYRLSFLQEQNKLSVTMRCPY